MIHPCRVFLFLLYLQNGKFPWRFFITSLVFINSSPPLSSALSYYPGSHLNLPPPPLYLLPTWITRVLSSCPSSVSFAVMNITTKSKLWGLGVHLTRYSSSSWAARAGAQACESLSSYKLSFLASRCLQAFLLKHLTLKVHS